MEVLVQWFTENLSQYISEEMVVFIISMIPIPGAERRAFGSVSS